MASLTSAAPQNPARFEHSDLAQFLSSLANEAHSDAKPRLQQAAGHFHQLATSPPPAPISPAQKDELKRLATHPLLSRQERTRVLLAYPRFTSEQAAETIKNLQSVCAALDDMRDAV